MKALVQALVAACFVLPLFAAAEADRPASRAAWEWSIDERLAARAIADHLGTKHEELAIAHIDPFELLDSARLFDQPFGNPTAHLMYLLSRRAA